ncbi:3-keto-disaccharide hydrolase (plasmid) [Catenovulum sp. SX2]|uniref:3-keto-disaccharide hydrolase n=1 Tax=Catenovulum sp. SX2 TaxID=3398614 RepID=UPI003F84E32E
MTVKIKKPLCLLTGLLILPAYAGDKSEWHYLIDKNLSQFEFWGGIPHSSVKGLPAGTFQSDDVTKGTPLGLNNDPLKIFSVIEEDGQPVIKVSGQIYAGINTLKSYGNYHLKFQFKWGMQRWEPRLTAKRDSGLLYHCTGEHGVFWHTWKACLEYQIQESDIGDYLGLKGPRGQYRGYQVESSNKPDKRDSGLYYYDPNSDNVITGARYTNAYIENDAPFGNWNTVELYAIGDEAVHMVNGEVVMFVENLHTKTGEPLTSGQIQFQSEAAEIYYRDMKIRHVKKLPAEVEAQIRRIDG